MSLDWEWALRLTLLLAYVYAVAHIVFAAYFAQKRAYHLRIINELDGGRKTK